MNQTVETSKLRIRWSKSDDLALPVTAKLLCDMWRGLGARELYCSVPGLPVTQNHMYIKHTHVLVPEIGQYRDLVAYVLGYRKSEWKPRGAVAGVFVFEAPLWVTKANEIKNADADNRVKCGLDALAKATQMPDQQVWEVHAYKLVSKRTRTRMWLYDLGDVVDGCLLTE